mgnify:CR=1 FL=1
MGKAGFQPTYDAAVAIASRRIAERRERDKYDIGGASSDRRASEAIQDATLVAELFGVTTRQALEDAEREAREREEA